MDGERWDVSDGLRRWLAGPARKDRALASHCSREFAPAIFQDREGLSNLQRLRGARGARGDATLRRGGEGGKSRKNAIEGGEAALRIGEIDPRQRCRYLDPAALG